MWRIGHIYLLMNLKLTAIIILCHEQTPKSIKADRPLTCDTFNAPWLLTDNSNGLVMVIRNYHWLNWASRVLISTCSAPLVQTGKRKQFSLFNLDLWPTTLTNNPRLTKVKVDHHARNQSRPISPIWPQSWLPWQHPLRDHKPKVRFIIYTHKFLQSLKTWWRVVR